MLISLFLRILSGERLKKAPHGTTAWWLGFLAIYPVAMISFVALIRFCEEVLDFAFDHPSRIVLLTTLVFIVWLLVLRIVAYSFRKCFMWLIPVSFLTWTGLARFLWNGFSF